MDLQNWQVRLDEHFSSLRARRPAAEPIFALEHGLDEQEVAAVLAAVRAEILVGEARWQYRLPWTIYAAETGYLYSGDEYWQTFEEQTPGWLQNGDRYWVRRCFFDFQQRYGGAKPTGPWARHFSIICWPITHAILPRDLQQQLAKILFELRYVITSDALATPRRLGDLVAGRSWNTSSRFQGLAQEPLLIGQIATALLLPEEHRQSSLILPATLSRIGEDLDREQRVRSWMRGARESAQRHFHFLHGAVPPHGRGADAEYDKDQMRGQTTVGIEPHLLLRPAAEGRWNIMLEVPDFGHVPARFPSLRDSLIRSRCRVVGSLDRPLARGRLMFGPQRILLRQWPPENQPLLEFERSTAELNYLLKAECLLRPGPTWLFKVASDGLAYELRAAHVRADNKYVLLSHAAPKALAPPFVTAAVMQCDGVYGALLNLPRALTPALEHVLDSLGVPKAGTVEIWPAGLMPARWDGDGNAEWLSTENPCIGLRADHPVAAYSLDLGGRAFMVEAGRTGEPVFIQLPRLGVGRHTLRVSATGASDGSVSDPTVLDIQIRAPRVTVSGSSSQSALLVIVYPNAPTLEQLWEGGVEIELHGPRGQRVVCSVSLFGKGDTVPHLERKLQGLTIPVSPSNWSAFIEKRIKDDHKIQNAYDLAHRCEVHLRAGEFGAFTLIAEREFAPFRWAVSRKQHAFHLRAIDDSGGQAATEVRLYEFGTPDAGRLLDTAPFRIGAGAKARSGLYAANAGDHHRAVVIPPEVHTFADLRLEPRLLARRRTPSDIVALVRLLDLWAGARLTGNVFSRTMRRKVMEFLLEEVFRLISGDVWRTVERSLDPESGDKAVRNAIHAISPRREQAGLGAEIARDIVELAAMAAEKRALRLAELGHKYLGLSHPSNRGDRISVVARRDATTLIQRRRGPENPAWLSEFALRLATCPEGLIQWAGEHLEDGAKRMLEIPTLARGARFMVLVIRRQGVPANTGSGLLYDSWEWR